MSGKNFDQQEQFDTQTVEAVTGVRGGTLRQWENRRIYTCDLRRRAESSQWLLVSSQSDVADRAKGVLRAYERGWRSYTIGDLLRITYIATLIDLGIEARAAGEAAMNLVLPEADSNYIKSSRRELILERNPENDPDRPDEFLVFAPKLPISPQFSSSSLGNPFKFRLRKPTTRDGGDAGVALLLAGREWERVFGAFALLGPGAGVVVNLSEIWRTTLRRLESLEFQR